MASSTPTLRSLAGEKRSIAIDATALLGRPTGIGQYVSGLIDEFSLRENLSVTAFAVSYRQEGFSHLLPKGIHVATKTMAARPLHLAWRYVSWPRIEHFTGKVDVVHGTNFVVPPARRAARVVSVHDLTMFKYPELSTPATLQFIKSIKKAVRTGATIHTHTEAIANEINAVLGARDDQVFVVAPGLPAIAVPAGGPLDVVLPPTVERYVLAIGTAEPRKDLPGLVDAFDQIAGDQRDLGLVLVGPDGWGVKALDAAIERARFRARILRVGWADDQTLASYLVGASALAYPSLYEGFGFPPLQAMAAGIPVVATNTEVAAEVLGDAAILVPPKDTSALSVALAAVVTDVSLRRDLEIRGRRRSSRYSWRRCADEMEGLYASAIERAR